MDTSTETLVGPIQLVVIGFPPDAEFRGETIRALTNLRGRGVIRLIDALFVRKDGQGQISASMRESDLTLHEREALGAVVGALLGVMAGGDAAATQDVIDTLIAADLIKQEALGEARAAVEQSKTA